jgi:hypothetical protein
MFETERFSPVPIPRISAISPVFSLGADIAGGGALLQPKVQSLVVRYLCATPLRQYSG